MQINSTTRTYWYMLSPALLVLSFFLFYPVLWSLLVSFREVRSIDLRNSTLFVLPGEFNFVDNYKKILADALFWKALRNTLYYAILYIPLSIATSLSLALLIRQNLKGANFFRTTLFLPYIISIVSVSLLFQALFRSESGLINTILRLFMDSPPQWLSHPWLAMVVIALMGVWRKMGYYMLIYIAGLNNIDGSLHEAAKIDGASPWQAFTHITLPLLHRISFLVSILLLVDTFKVFQEVLIMTGGGPDNATLTFPFLIYNEAFKFLRMGSAAAMSYILFIITVVIAIIQHKVQSKHE